MMAFMLCGGTAFHACGYTDVLTIAGATKDHASAFVGSWVESFPAVSVRGDVRSMYPGAIESEGARRLLEHCIFHRDGTLSHVSMPLLSFLKRAYMISTNASSVKIETKTPENRNCVGITNRGRVIRFKAKPSNDWACTAGIHTRLSSDIIDEGASALFKSNVCISCSKRLLDIAPPGWHALQSAAHLVDKKFYETVLMPMTDVPLRPLLFGSILRNVSPKSFDVFELKRFDAIVDAYPGLVMLVGLKLDNITKFCSQRRSWLEVMRPRLYRYLSSLFTVTKKSIRTNSGAIGIVPFHVTSLSYHGGISLGDAKSRSIANVLKVISTDTRELPKEPLAIIGKDVMALTCALRLWDLLNTGKCSLQISLAVPQRCATKHHETSGVCIIRGGEHATWPMMYKAAECSNHIIITGSYFVARWGVKCAAGLVTGGVFARLAEASRQNHQHIKAMQLGSEHMPSDSSLILSKVLDVERLWWKSSDMFQDEFDRYTLMLIRKPDTPFARFLSRVLTDTFQGDFRLPMAGPLSRYGRKRARVESAPESKPSRRTQRRKYLTPAIVDDP